MRYATLSFALILTAACNAERAVAPDPQPRSTSALASCQQSSAGCGDPMLIIDGAISSYRLMDLKGSDIESIEVIKGEAAMRLYGDGARHGVLIVKTKQRD